MDDRDRDLERAETQASETLSRRRTSHTNSSDSSTLSIDRTNFHHPTHAERYQSARIQHANTVGSHPESRSLASIKAQAIPRTLGGGKPFPPDIPAEREAYVVDFHGPDDPLHSMNWKTSRSIFHNRICYGMLLTSPRITTSAISALACICSTFASSVVSPATPAFRRHFGVSVEVGSLASALYLVRYGVGPALWAPLSELRGRKLPLALGNFGFSVLAVAVAASKDIQTLMIPHFFMGLFGSAPLVVVPALYADIWRAEKRGFALLIFAVSVFIGPMLGPFIGSFTVTTSYLGWR